MKRVRLRSILFEKHSNSVFKVKERAWIMAYLLDFSGNSLQESDQSGTQSREKELDIGPRTKTELKRSLPPRPP